MRDARTIWLHTWLAAVLLACSGCFQVSTLVTVNGDGSGTIRQRALFTTASLAQIRQFAALAGGAQSFDPLSEQQARDAADTMGPGVTYVSSTPIDTAEGQGRDITYAFTDVNQLRFDAQPPTPGGLMGGGQGIGTATRATFTLTRQPDGLSILRVTVPQLSLAGGRRIGPAGTMPSNDEMALVRPLIAGARLAIAIEPAGQLVRTTSPWVDGPRVSLIDIDFDQFLRDDTLRPLRAARTVDEAKEVLKGVPGVKINFEPEISIEFRPTAR